MLLKVDIKCYCVKNKGGILYEKNSIKRSMVALLRLIRLQKKQSLQICAIVMLGSCICWGMSARILPWLYETSAVGVWIVTFLVFAMFFINEIHYIAEMRKEGKMYGIVA